MEEGKITSVQVETATKQNNLIHYLAKASENPLALEIFKKIDRTRVEAESEEINEMGETLRCF